MTALLIALAVAASVAALGLAGVVLWFLLRLEPDCDVDPEP